MRAPITSYHEPVTLPLDALLRPAPIVLIVPPFHWTNRPAIGVHLLQGIARRAGVEVQIVYANIMFAARFGQRNYAMLSTLQYNTFIGERLFARAAYGLPPLGRDGGANLVPRLEAMQRMYEASGKPFDLSLDDFLLIESAVGAWVDSLALAIAGGPAVVGCTSSFEQNAASLAILRAIKWHAPDTTTILGGANCEGPMGRGLLEMTDVVDHVFSGESEETFREFVEHVRRGAAPSARLFEGRPCEDLEGLPVPDYADYYAQLAAWMPDELEEAQLAFESSRGCWWGEKKHCTFCGLNGQGMASREKSADRSLAELATLLERHPNRKIAVTDNIMPHSYWKTFVPRLAAELPGLDMMYEQKANLTLEQMCALARAGITEIQPGIESISTGLLKLMSKGTTAAQNIALLRYAAALGITVQWNLLCGFPNDELAFYLETLELLPLMHHLPPPRVSTPIIIDRFSPYHSFPERYGIRALRPADGYLDVLPEHADADLVAYHFQGEFASASLAHPDLVSQLGRGVAAWRSSYHGPSRPELTVVGELDGELELVDTRGRPGAVPRRSITRAEAIAALVPRRATPELRSSMAWALEAGVVVIRDGRYVPLAIATPELMSAAAHATTTSEHLRAVS